MTQITIICRVCKIAGCPALFRARKARENGVENLCKKCENLKRSTPEQRAKQKAYRDAHKEETKEYGVIYRAENATELKTYRDTNRVSLRKYDEEYRKNNRAKRAQATKISRSKPAGKLSAKLANKRYRQRNKGACNARHRRYIKKRKATDLNFKLLCAMRNRLNMAVSHGYKAGSAVEDLGCSIEFFKEYMTSKFQPGMTWTNWGTKGWHIDHIRPLCTFNLTDRAELLIACHYTNLQPLWAEDNLKKSKKYVPQDGSFNPR